MGFYRGDNCVIAPSLFILSRLNLAALHARVRPGYQGLAMARPAPRIYIQNICLRSKTGEYPAAALGNENPSLQQNLEYILHFVRSSDIVSFLLYFDCFPLNDL